MISAPGAGLTGKFRELHRRCWRPAFLAVFGDDCGKDAAADIEAGRQPHVAWFRRACQVVKDAVGHVLVETAGVAEGPDVELQAFQLDAGPGRDVIENQRREVRLSGFWAQAGKFRDFHVDMKITPRGRIGEGFEGWGRMGVHCYSGWHSRGNESGGRNAIIGSCDGIPGEYFSLGYCPSKG